MMRWAAQLPEAAPGASAREGSVGPARMRKTRSSSKISSTIWKGSKRRVSRIASGAASGTGLGAARMTISRSMLISPSWAESWRTAAPMASGVAGASRARPCAMDSKVGAASCARAGAAARRRTAGGGPGADHCEVSPGLVAVSPGWKCPSSGAAERRRR